MKIKIIQRGVLLFSIALLAILNLKVAADIFTSNRNSSAEAVGSDAFSNLELFTHTMELIRHHYVGKNEPEYGDLVKEAIKGMLSSLDRHSQYMEPRHYDAMQEDAKGHFGGLGIVIASDAEHIRVVSAREDTPAYRAGIMADDIILAIEGEDTAGLSVAEAVEMLRGEVDTRVRLTIQRDEEEESFEVELVRAVIDIRSVMGMRMLDDGITYMRLTKFSQMAADELREAIEEYMEKGMTGLILDLRDNPGGLLPAAVAVSDVFLKKDAPIVRTRGRDDDNHEYTAESEPTLPTSIPMAILINGGSASASEIVAGALKDNHRAMLVGERSYGKGSVQSVFPINDGSAIRITVAMYYTPSETLIEEHGIRPDIEVEISPREWARIRTTYRTEDIAGDLEDGFNIEDTSDVQLRMAVQVMRGARLLSGATVN